jgi:hypothetical protein
VLIIVALTLHKKKLVEESQKALYAVYYKIWNLRLPIDFQLKIFDWLVAPMLLVGCEISGIGKKWQHWESTPSIFEKNPKC